MDLSQTQLLMLLLVDATYNMLGRVNVEQVEEARLCKRFCGQVVQKLIYQFIFIFADSNHLSAISIVIR